MTAVSGVVTSKGQLVIPAPIRRRMGIRKGTKVTFQQDGDRLIVQPITDHFIRSLQGSLKPRGKRSMLTTLLRERRRERVA